MDFYSSENNFLRLAHRAASLSISSDFLHTIDQVDSGLMLPATARIHTRVTSNRRMEKDPLLRGRVRGVSNKLFLLFRSHIGSQVLPTDMLVDVSSKLVQLGRGAWLQICKPNLCLVPSQKHPSVFQFSSQDLQTSMLSTIASPTKNIGLTFVISSRSSLGCFSPAWGTLPAPF